MERMILAGVHSLWISAAIAVLAHLLTIRQRDAATRYWIHIVALALVSASPVLAWMATVSSLAPVAVASTVSESFARAAVLAWAIGIAIGAINLYRELAQIQRLKSLPSLALPDWLFDMVGRVSLRIGSANPSQVILHPDISVPGVVGGLKFALLLPVSILNQLSVAECEAIIAHELAHARRFDYVINLFQRAVEVVWFYNPSIWWLSRRVRIEREYVCDAMASQLVGNPRPLATALAKLAHAHGPVPGLVAASTGGAVADRIRVLAGSTRRVQAATVPTLITAFGLCATLFGLMESPKAELPMIREGFTWVQATGGPTLPPEMIELGLHPTSVKLPEEMIQIERDMVTGRQVTIHIRTTASSSHSESEFVQLRIGVPRTDE